MADTDAQEREINYWKEIAKAADENATEVVVIKGTQRQREAAERDAIVEGARISVAM